MNFSRWGGGTPQRLSFWLIFHNRQHALRRGENVKHLNNIRQTLIDVKDIPGKTRRRRVKKDVMIAGRTTPVLKKQFKEALAKAEGLDSDSDFIRDCAQALIKQTTRGDTLAQPLRFLTEDWKRALILAGIEI